MSGLENIHADKQLQAAYREKQRAIAVLSAEIARRLVHLPATAKDWGIVGDLETVAEYLTNALAFLPSQSKPAKPAKARH